MRRTPSETRSSGVQSLYIEAMYSVIRQAPGRPPTKRNRAACCRHYDFLEKSPFISYVEEHFFEDKWSLDVCVHRALKDGSFIREQIVCTKKLYNYANLGLLRIKNIDLPEKLRRSPKKTRVLKNKRIERKTREYWIIRVPGRDPNGVMTALSEIRSRYGEHRNDIFKTIATDNGSEFSLLSRLEDLSKTLVYFAHPYTSCEKEPVERHNGLIRRFIPKERRIDSFSDEQTCQIEV